MSKQPDELDVQWWHRYFAARSNNRAWELMGPGEHAVDDEREMIDAAHAASWHWAKVGAPVNRLRADVALAMAYAWAGRGAEAGRFAALAQEYCASQPYEDWDLAFVHLASSFAAAQAGDGAQAAHFNGLAHEAGEQIADDEDREIFLAQLAGVEKYLSTR